MKKLLVLLVSAALVLSMAAVSMADVKVSGEVSAKYSFEKGSDVSEGKISFESKLNDEVSAKLVFKGASDKNPKWDMFIDEYNFTYKPGFADIQVGYWGYKSKGLVDVISYVFDDFKSDAAILVSKNLDNGFNLGLWYTTDECTIKEDVEDNAFVFNFGYVNDYVDLDAFLIDKAYKTSELSYSLTAALTMFEGITPYASYGINRVEAANDDESLVLGVKYVLDALEIRAEYDIEEDVIGDDAWGLKVKYAWDNGIFAEYVYKTFDNADAAGADKETNEIKFGVKFK